MSHTEAVDDPSHNPPSGVNFACGCKSCRKVLWFSVDWYDAEKVRARVAEEGWTRDERGFHFCPSCPPAAG